MKCNYTLQSPHREVTVPYGFLSDRPRPVVDLVVEVVFLVELASPFVFLRLPLCNERDPQFNPITRINVS